VVYADPPWTYYGDPNKDQACGKHYDCLTDAELAALPVRDIWKRTTIITLTEFGRRLDENASQGLDHGWASAMFVMGGGVKGGKVIADCPGLSPAALRDGDLQVTLDYRHVLSEVLRYRGGISAEGLASILPDFKSKDLGLVRQLGA
jgi:uncharacterized protein (DUF1501 family)